MKERPRKGAFFCVTGDNHGTGTGSSVGVGAGTGSRAGTWRGSFSGGRTGAGTSYSRSGLPISPIDTASAQHQATNSYKQN